MLEEYLNERVWHRLLNRPAEFLDAAWDMADVMSSAMMSDDEASRAYRNGLFRKEVGAKAITALQSIVARVRYGAEASEDERAIAKLIEVAAESYLKDAVADMA